MEAIESGAEVLLMDEDTCATNFIVRDSKMQQLVAKKDEPITPFIDTVRQLYTEKNISTVLVLGGVGDYFDVADHVIQMTEYRPTDVTCRAREIAAQFPVKTTHGGQIPSHYDSRSDSPCREFRPAQYLWQIQDFCQGSGPASLWPAGCRPHGPRATGGTIPDPGHRVRAGIRQNIHGRDNAPARRHSARHRGISKKKESM